MAYYYLEPVPSIFKGQCRKLNNTILKVHVFSLNSLPTNGAMWYVYEGALAVPIFHQTGFFSFFIYEMLQDSRLKMFVRNTLKPKIIALFLTSEKFFFGKVWSS